MCRENQCLHENGWNNLSSSFVRRTGECQSKEMSGFSLNGTVRLKGKRVEYG